MADNPPTSNDSATTTHLRGSVLLVVGRVLAILINFVVQVLTVRYLTKDDYGVFAFALSVANILSVLSAFGMDKAVSRYLAVYLQDRDYRRFWGMLVLMFVTVMGLGGVAVALFSATAALGVPLLSSNVNTQIVLAVLAGLAMCNALDALLVALFAVLASPAAVFVRRHVLGPLLRLAAAVAVIMVGGDVLAFAVGQLIAGLLGVAICAKLLVAILARNPELRSAMSDRFIYPVGQLFRYSGTLLSGDLAYLLRFAMPPLVLGLMFAGREVATFQAVVPIARLNQFVLLMFSVLFLPNAARLAAAKRDAELQSFFEATALWVALLSFPLFAISFVASDVLPILLFGQEYQSSGSILALLALGYYANACFGTHLRLLRAAGNLRTLLVADLLLMGVTIGLLFALIPRFGALGGAWAVCGAYFAQAILYQFLVATHTHVNPFTWRCLGPFVAGVGLCVAGDYAREIFGAGWLFSCIATGLTIVAVLVLFGRQLDLIGTFPELFRLPLLRRWKLATPAEGGPR